MERRSFFKAIAGSLTTLLIAKKISEFKVDETPEVRERVIALREDYRMDIHGVPIKNQTRKYFKVIIDEDDLIRNVEITKDEYDNTQISYRL